MKQTAVEWLINEIQTKHDKSFIEFYGSEITQAKEMEKKQIENAFEAGFVTQQWDKTKENKAEQYYNETLEDKLDKIVSKQQSKFWAESDERFKNKETLEEWVEQAKEMEKQQIINACNSNFTYGNNGYPTLGEIYYNETFNLSQQDKP